MDDEVKAALKKVALGCGALTGLLAVIAIIVTLASIKTLGPEDQVVIHYLNGKAVVNGPTVKVLNPFRDKDWRKALRIGNLEYVRIVDKLNGDVRVVEGHAKIFLQAYEQVDDAGIQEKIVVKQDQFIRLIDRLTGSERVMTGADSIVPRKWEQSSKGVEQASFISMDKAAIVQNRKDGSKTLVDTRGPFFPKPYEEVVEMRTLVRVLPHETMVVRDAFGRYVVYKGAGENGDQNGVSFFLGPFDAMVEMEWSSFSEPAEGGEQVISWEMVDRIDMRARKTFFQYDVRTNDNVALRIEGAMFWKIVDVAKMLEMTADPVGDCWYNERVRIIATVSKATLEKFMEEFNERIQAAFEADLAPGTPDYEFYQKRGLTVSSIEVTKYDCIDVETAATLQDIIKETTNRINRLQAQRSENDVKLAKINADIDLEKKRKALLTKKSENDLLVAARDGEAEGVEMATSAATFINGLNTTISDLDERVELYKMHKNLENQNARTESIAGGKATLFITPEDFNLALSVPPSSR